MSEEISNKLEVAIIGGGLGGLVAATYLARAGKKVSLFEKAHELGGRGISYTSHDFIFNLGPHALYRGNHGEAVLRELGISFKGGIPNTKGGGMLEGKIYPLPGGVKDTITTGLLTIPAKLELAGLLGSINKMNPADYRNITLNDWLQQHVHNSSTRLLLETLARVSTYANAPEIMAAEVFLTQLQLSLKNSVYYIDGGWQTLVDSLEKAALEAGVKIIRGARVEKVKSHSLNLADGSKYEADEIIIAATPHAATEILDSPELKAAAEYSKPVRAACLNVALKRLPKPSNTFGLGIDHPLYFSVHSATAKLAPEGRAVIHLAKYLAVGEKSDPTKDRDELENMLELFQPGWRDELVEVRFMPNLTVYNAVVTAERGGLAGRTPVSLPGYNNIYLVGDWVGSEGILSDATFASARFAAQAILSKNPARQEAITAGR